MQQRRQRPRTKSSLSSLKCYPTYKILIPNNDDDLFLSVTCLLVLYMGGPVTTTDFIFKATYPLFIESRPNQIFHNKES